MRIVGPVRQLVFGHNDDAPGSLRDGIEIFEHIWGFGEAVMSPQELRSFHEGKFLTWATSMTDWNKLDGMIADAVKSDGPLPPDVASQSLLASRIREAATEKPLPVGQTPDIAKTISGKVFRFADNPLRLDSLTLTLDGPHPSYAYAFKPARPDSAAERFEGPIGIDGLYRTGSPRPEGTIPAAKGGWS